MNGNDKSKTWTVGISEGHSKSIGTRSGDFNIGITPEENCTFSVVRSNSYGITEYQTRTGSFDISSEEEWKKTKAMFRDIFHVAPIVLRDLADVSPSSVSVSHHEQLREIARTLADIFEVFYEDLTS